MATLWLTLGDAWAEPGSLCIARGKSAHSIFRLGLRRHCCVNVPLVREMFKAWRITCATSTTGWSFQNRACPLHRVSFGKNSATTPWVSGEARGRSRCQTVQFPLTWDIRFVVAGPQHAPPGNPRSTSLKHLSGIEDERRDRCTRDPNSAGVPQDRQRARRHGIGLPPPTLCRR
jgi:hypothetical protein